jgi:hypothetical protein
MPWKAPLVGVQGRFIVPQFWEPVSEPREGCHPNSGHRCSRPRLGSADTSRSDPLSGHGNYQICLMCGCRRSDAVEAQNEVMETWDALRARRNVRKFTAQPVPEEALNRILEAGRPLDPGVAQVAGERCVGDFV